MTDIAYHWEKIGIALEVETHVLHALRRNNEDNTTKLINVLQSWLDTFPSVCTWDVVLTAVEGPIVNQRSTAMKIRHFLANPEVQSKYIIEIVTTENRKELGWYRSCRNNMQCSFLRINYIVYAVQSSYNSSSTKITTE